MTGLVPILRAGVAGQEMRAPVHVDPASVRWAIHTGLGPLLSSIERQHLSVISDPESLTQLRGADLAAQLAMSETLDALEEMLAASPAIAREITLLKGISACLALYPAPHLRTMGDIDVLVPVHSQVKFESLLHDLGYRQQSNRPADYYQAHHHSMPFYHPARQLWVEVHTALFSNAHVATDPVFLPSRIGSRIEPVTFRGHMVNRLKHELDILYIAAHWALERKCFAGGALPFVDLAFLIRNHGNTLNWEQVLAELHGSRTADSLYLMLGFLKKQDIISIPQEAWEQLSALSRARLGKNERALHGMIESYSMLGRPFGKVLSEANLGIIWDTLLAPPPAWRNTLRVPVNIAFPPGQARRFSPGFQLSRLAGLLGIRKRRLL